MRLLLTPLRNDRSMPLRKYRKVGGKRGDKDACMQQCRHAVHADVSLAYITNDDLFDRLETVRFFRLFTGEGATWRTWAEVIQNPEA
jgi:hypothetical protein